MALTVQAGGKTFTFPDNTSQADIEEAVNTNVGTSQKDYQNYVIEAAKQRGLPLDMVMGMLNNESSGADPKHFVGGKIEGSTERAQGPLQIRPSTAEGLGYNRDEVIRDPRVATDAALDYAKQNYEKFGGDKVKTLKSHFGGPGNADSTNPNIQSYADRAMAYGTQWLNTATQNNNPQVVSQPQAGTPPQAAPEGSQQPQQPQAGQPTVDLSQVPGRVSDAITSATGISPAQLSTSLFNPAMLINDHLKQYRTEHNDTLAGDNGTYYTPPNPYVAPPAASTAGFNPLAQPGAITGYNADGTPIITQAPPSQRPDIPSVPAVKFDAMGKPINAAAPGGNGGLTPDINQPFREVGQGVVSGTENLLQGTNKFLNNLPIVGPAFRALDLVPATGAKLGAAAGTDVVGPAVGKAVGHAYYGDNAQSQRVAQNPAFQPIPADNKVAFDNTGALNTTKMVDRPQTETGRQVEAITPYIEGMAFGNGSMSGAQAGRNMIGAVAKESPALAEWMAQFPAIRAIIGGGGRTVNALASQAPSNLAGAIANEQSIGTPGESTGQYYGNVAKDFAANEVLGMGMDAIIGHAFPRIFKPKDYALSRASEEAGAAREHFVGPAGHQPRQYDEFGNPLETDEVYKQKAGPQAVERENIRRTQSVQGTQEAADHALNRHNDVVGMYGPAAQQSHAAADAFTAQAQQAASVGDAATAQQSANAAVAYRQQARNFEDVISQSREAANNAQRHANNVATDFEHKFRRLFSENAENMVDHTGASVGVRNERFTPQQMDTEIARMEEAQGAPLTDSQRKSYINARMEGRDFVAEDDAHPFNYLNMERDIPQLEGEGSVAYARRVRQELKQRKENFKAQQELERSQRGPLDIGRKQPLGVLDEVARRSNEAMAMNRNGAQAGITDILKDPTHERSVRRYLAATGITPARIEKWSNPKGGFKSLMEFFGVKNPELTENKGLAAKKIITTIDDNLTKGYGLDTGESVLEQARRDDMFGLGDNKVHTNLAGLEARDIHNFGNGMKEAINAIKNRDFNTVNEVLGNLRQQHSRLAGEVEAISPTGTGINSGKKILTINGHPTSLQAIHDSLTHVKHDINTIDSLANFAQQAGIKGEMSNRMANVYGAGLAASLFTLFHAASLGTASAGLGAILGARSMVKAARSKGLKDLYDAMYGRYNPGLLGSLAQRSSAAATATNSIHKGKKDLKHEREKELSERQKDLVKWHAATDPNNLQRMYPEELAGSQLSKIANKMGVDDIALANTINSNDLFLRSFRDPEGAKKEVILAVLETAAGIAATQGLGLAAPAISGAAGMASGPVAKAVAANAGNIAEAGRNALMTVRAASAGKKVYDKVNEQPKRAKFKRKPKAKETQRRNK